MQRLFGLLEWLTNILILHFMWVIYILRGAIILGLFPATAGVYAVIRHWLRNKDDEDISVLFKRFYLENFRTANILGWLFTLVTFILVYNWMFLPYYTSPALKLVMYGIVIFFSFLMIVIWLYLFPVIVHYQSPIKNYFIIIIKIAVVSLPSIIMQLLLIGIYVGIVYYLPPVIILFGITFIAVVQMAITNNIFRRFDENSAK